MTVYTLSNQHEEEGWDRGQNGRALWPVIRKTWQLGAQGIRECWTFISSEKEVKILAKDGRTM